MAKVVRKDYIPNSHAFKLTYDDGSIGYGADPSKDELKPVVDSLRSQPTTTLPQKKTPTIDESGSSEINDNIMNQARAITGASATKDELDKVIQQIKEGSYPRRYDNPAYAEIEYKNGSPVLNDRQKNIMNRAMTMIDMGVDPLSLPEEDKAILRVMTDTFD